MQGAFLLDVVITQSTSIFQLLACSISHYFEIKNHCSYVVDHIFFIVDPPLPGLLSYLDTGLLQVLFVVLDSRTDGLSIDELPHPVAAQQQLVPGIVDFESSYIRVATHAHTVRDQVSARPAHRESRELPSLDEHPVRDVSLEFLNFSTLLEYSFLLLWQCWLVVYRNLFGLLLATVVNADNALGVSNMCDLDLARFVVNQRHGDCGSAECTVKLAGFVALGDHLLLDFVEASFQHLGHV